MGFFYSVRGWLHTSDRERQEQVRAIIERDKAENGYSRFWFLSPTPCPGYAFFGAEVRDVSLGIVREQIRTLATVFSRDEPYIDYVEGCFHADAEDGSVQLIWECREGRLEEYNNPHPRNRLDPELPL